MSPVLTLILTITFVASPFFADPFSGFEADQLPIPQVDPPVQPAGYAFSIWGLIYAWLLVSAVYGVWRRRADAAWDRARWPLIISLAVGTPWIAVANASAIWATILIIVMAVFAIAALIRAPREDRWLLQAPVAIYAGWLTAASFVSIGSTMAGYGLWFGQLDWAYAGVAGALAVALGVLSVKRRAPEYGLTVIWALVGIVVANAAVHVGLAATAALGIVAVAAVAYVNWSRAARS